MMKKVELGEVLKYEQPSKYLVRSENYNDSFETPVLTAGKSFLLGYTDETDNIFDNVPVIIFDDFTTSFQYVDFPFKVKSSAMKILNCDHSKANIRYLYYLMHLIKIDTIRHKRYWISEYSKIKIPLPNLATQKAIAARLDLAEKVKNLNQQLLEKYDELAQSVFLEMFGDPVLNEKGWEVKKLGEYLQLIGGGVFKSKDYVDEGIPLIRIGAINKGYFDENALVFISEKFLKTHEKYLLKKGDMLITLTGTVGKDDYGNIYILQDEYPQYFLNQRVAKLDLNKDFLDTSYFKFLLTHDGIKSRLTNVSRGVRQANISNKDIYDLLIPFPPLSLQTEFARRIENIEHQKLLLRLEMAKSEELFESLLQESFSPL